MFRFIHGAEKFWYVTSEEIDREDKYKHFEYRNYESPAISFGATRVQSFIAALHQLPTSRVLKFSQFVKLSKNFKK